MHGAPTSVAPATVAGRSRLVEQAQQTVERIEESDTEPGVRIRERTGGD